MINLNDRVTTKKPHPCGSAEWTVVRVGADIKIKCCGCGRVVMLTTDEFTKKVKTVNGKNF